MMKYNSKIFARSICAVMAGIIIFYGNFCIFLIFDLFVLFCPLKSVPVALNLHYKAAIITHNVG